jgi:hypothetical protein
LDRIYLAKVDKEVQGEMLHLTFQKKGEKFDSPVEDPNWKREFVISADLLFNLINGVQGARYGTEEERDRLRRFIQAAFKGDIVSLQAFGIGDP